MPNANFCFTEEVRSSAPKLTNSAVALLSKSYMPAVIAIWRDASIAEYLTASDARRHVWHCWLAMHDGGQFNPADAYNFLTFSKAKAILLGAFGECPSGLINALKRLGPFARERVSYIYLYRIFAHGGPLARYLSSLPQISDGDLCALSSMLAIPASDTIIRAILKCRMPASVMQELLWIASRLAETDGEDQIVRSIRRSRNPETIVGDLFGLQPFPEPPFVPVKGITPITTAEQLRDVGRRFENCLRNRDDYARVLLSIHAGHRYYFQLHGDFPALLAFSKCGSAGWVLTEQAGPGNLRLSPATQTLVIEILAGFPFVHANGFAHGILGWMTHG